MLIMCGLREETMKEEEEARASLSHHGAKVVLKPSSHRKGGCTC